METAFVGLGVQEAIIILAILIVITFHIMMIVHVLSRKDVSFFWFKALWLLVIVCIPIAGPVAYRLFAYSKRPQQ